MGQLNVAQGHLFGTIFEAGLYGIYLVLFIACLYIFRNSGRRYTRSNRIIMATIWLMFCISTAHIGGTIQSLQAGFFGVRPATPEIYFNDKSKPLNLMNKSLYGINIVVGDSLLIYRLHVMYPSQRWIVVPPVLTVLATAVSWSLMVWEFSRLAPGQTAFAESIKKLAPAAFSLSLVTNLMITALIVHRIRQAERRLRKAIHEADVSFYRALLANTIESCILYPMALVITLGLYGTGNNGQDVLTGPMTQIISITPTLLWMQVRLGFSRFDAAVSAEASTLVRPTGASTPIVLVTRSTRTDTSSSSSKANDPEQT
ncbi:hypothetical protein NEOLEDRAFT_1132463 [Neolentinus lepideus HHB14362 ss-1]|uniref:Fungal pheromone STE3G-protein-coupled receptor n=1 Tax=Neolentinus lepideus HHB14362 ss-1 TaxID=1314782 RepID=A0A165TB33_9AGAM|nr:hypothetical protein NEOLEDRAFT_1132463 [Neolentinus lepideus HHB14362 ss-1]